MSQFAKVIRPDIAPGRRVLAISDIHGNLPFLKGVLSAAGYGAGDVLVLVGDLVEKGPDSLSALRFIMELSRRQTVYALNGNCDNLVTDFAAGAELPGDFYRHYLQVWGERSLILQMARAAGYEGGPPWDLEALRANKTAELSAACEQAIVAGLDIQLGEAVEHFNYNEKDQINIKEMFDAVRMGAVGEWQSGADYALIHEPGGLAYCKHIAFYITDGAVTAIQVEDLMDGRLLG